MMTELLPVLLGELQGGRPARPHDHPAEPPPDTLHDGVDILVAIAVDRDDLERQLRSIQAGLDPRPSQRRPDDEVACQIEDLATAVRLHAMVKQEVFYAACLRDELLREMTMKLVVQQETIDFLLLKLLVADLGERIETRGLLSVLSDQLRHHARTEQEGALCAGVTGSFSLEARTTMGRDFTVRKQALRAHVEREIQLLVA